MSSEFGTLRGVLREEAIIYVALLELGGYSFFFGLFETWRVRSAMLTTVADDLSVIFS